MLPTRATFHCRQYLRRNLDSRDPVGHDGVSVLGVHRGYLALDAIAVVLHRLGIPACSASLDPWKRERRVSLGLLVRF